MRLIGRGGIKKLVKGWIEVLEYTEAAYEQSRAEYLCP